jgi:prepilin-type N-terminal cleavage/methylation domain-containing protein
VGAARQGFTVAEVLVAVVVFTVGVLALVGASAGMGRMIGRGSQATVAAAVVAGRIEQLHRIASSTSPPCTATEWRGDSATEAGIAHRWDVLDAAGIARRVRIVAQQRSPSGTRTDTVMTAVLCQPE